MAVIALLGLVVQLVRRRPLRRWGITAGIAFAVFVVATIAGAPNTKTAPEQTTSPPVTNTTTSSENTTGGTTAAQTTTDATSSPRYISGLSGSDLQSQLESRGFTCTSSRDVAPADPQGKGPIGSESDCTSALSSSANLAKTVDVTIHNYSDDNVDEITGTVYGLDTAPLLQLATIKYSDAQPDQAQQWVNENMGLVAFQAPRSTQFGSAKFELSGNPPNILTLDIYAPGLEK